MQVELQLANERYLRAHPEVGKLMAAFMEEALVKRPEDILPFACEFFTAPDLKAKLK